MRAFITVVGIFCSGLGHAADLPVFFDSGSDFSGTIIQRKIQGDPQVEARFAGLGEKISLRMLTFSGKAVILVARKVGTEKMFIDTFQMNNNETLFTGATAVLAEKAKQWDKASRQSNPFYRADVYQPREYPNKDAIVAAELVRPDRDARVRLPLPAVTIVLGAVDKDNVRGEVLVSDSNKFITETVWFDVKRDIVLPPAAEIVPAPAAPIPLPAPKK